MALAGVRTSMVSIGGLKPELSRSVTTARQVSALDEAGVRNCVGA